MSALPQTNASLLQVLQALPMRDSFAEEMGSGESQVEKWSGNAGIFIPPIAKRRESGTDGRDVVSTRSVYSRALTDFQIGDQLTINYRGEEVIWSVVGVRESAIGIEDAAIYELTIEEK